MSNAVTHDRWLRAKEAWDYLSCSQRKFRYLVAEGRITRYDTPFGQRYRLCELAEWVKSFRCENGQH